MTRVLDAARDLGYESAVLLGSAGYYSRFGFMPAARHGIFLFGPNPAKNLPYFLSRELTDKSQPWYGGFFEFPAICDVSGNEAKTFDAENRV